MRFGLVGTGWWARNVHGRGLASTPGVELVGVWGRDAASAERVAAKLGVTPFTSFPGLVETVDAVAFAVPPDVQSSLALEAAGAGRHLLLEKPVATTVDAARRLAAAAAPVATAVFVTSRYDAARPAWLEQLRSGAPWHGASALWLGAAFAEGSPLDTPWRHEHGALWDLGPHLVAMVEDALGPVASVRSAALGPHDVLQAAFDHGGASSAVTATISTAVPRRLVVVWGPSGTVEMPPGGDVLDAYRTCAAQLVTAAGGGPPAAVDVGGGLHLVEVLAEVATRLGATT